MLNTDDSVWTNAFYLMPGVAGFLIGPLQGIVAVLAGANLAYKSGRYHTTYKRDEQGGDVSALLTYLVALIAVILSGHSEWFLLLPVVAAPLHRRFVWEIDSYVAAPLYIGLALLLLTLQVGILYALIPAAFIGGGGAIKVLQPGPRSQLHSLWHVLGGASAASAIVLLSVFA